MNRTRALVLATLLALLAPLLTLAPAQAHNPRDEARSRVVYVVDRTSSYFDVHASGHDWSKSPYVRVTRVSSCSGRLHCATFVEENLEHPYAGLTLSWTTSAGGRHYLVKFDTDMRRATWRQRRHLVCHEFGHVFEIGHNGSGCMGDNDDPYPGSFNLSVAR